MQAIKPRWASWTFLLYAGGLTLLGAASSGLGYLASTHGGAGYTLWALLLLAAFSVIAFALLADGGHPIAAGIFAFSSVALFGGFLGALFSWFGWLDAGAGSAFGGFHVARLMLLLLVLVAALVALQLFRFPLIVLMIVVLAWFLLTDLVSGGGSWSAIVTFLVGLAFLAAAVSVDAGPNRPYGMWLHVGAGLTIGGSLVYFLHHSNFEWALIVLGGLLYILLADALDRSSWAVLGTVGILMAAVHYSIELTHVRLTIFGEGIGRGSRGWAPSVVFGCAGVLLLLLGGSLARRARGRAAT